MLLDSVLLNLAYFFDDPTMVFSIKLHGSISKTHSITETLKNIPH